MKRNYVDLLNLNRDLINGYRIRCTNHEELMKNLRFLNQMVQKAGNLRSAFIHCCNNECEDHPCSMAFLLVGKFKTSTINQCRTAIKGNNIQSLIKSIKTGSVQ